MLEGTRRGFGLSQKISDGGGWQIMVSSVCGLQIDMMKGPSGVAESGVRRPHHLGVHVHITIGIHDGSG